VQVYRGGSGRWVRLRKSGQGLAAVQYDDRYNVKNLVNRSILQVLDRELAAIEGDDI